MENNTDVRSDVEKMYDEAYQQGFKHCKKLFELLITQKTIGEISAIMDEFINEKFSNHMKQQIVQS